jgi:hypothetical protein
MLFCWRMLHISSLVHASYVVLPAAGKRFNPDDPFSSRQLLHCPIASKPHSRTTMTNVYIVTSVCQCLGSESDGPLADVHLRTPKNRPTSSAHLLKLASLFGHGCLLVYSPSFRLCSAFSLHSQGLSRIFLTFPFHTSFCPPMLQCSHATFYNP